MLGYQQASILSSGSQEEGPLAAGPDEESLLGNAEQAERLGLTGSNAPSGAGQLFGLDDAEQEPGPVPAGGSVPASVVAWVDGIVVPGLGVALSADFSPSLALLTADGNGSVTALNQGEGWLEIAIEAEGTGGASVGAGAMFGRTGAVGSATGSGGLTGSFTFRVPWTRLVDAPKAAELGWSALVGGGSPAEVLATLLDGVDLQPYAMEASVGGEVGGDANVDAGLVSDELGLDLSATAGVDAEVGYEDLPDTAGRREGALRLEGSVEALSEVVAHLELSLGADLSSPLAGVTDTVAVVVPFEETDGDRDWGLPYVEASMTVGAGPAQVGATVGLGPDHAEVALEAAITAGIPLWEDVVETLTALTGLASTGLVRLEESATLTAKLTVGVPEGFAAPDLFAAVVGGRAGQAVEAAIAAAEVEIAVDATLLAVDAGGQLCADDGPELGLAGVARASLVFQREDLVPDMASPPSPAELVALLRSTLEPSAPTTGVAKEA